MELELVNGTYTPEVLLELFELNFAHLIRYQESKIDTTTEEETISFRENNIKQLQNQWSALQKSLRSQPVNVSLELKAFIQ